jgi:hypothetical protein
MIMPQECRTGYLWIIKTTARAGQGNRTEMILSKPAGQSIAC